MSPTLSIPSVADPSLAASSAHSAPWSDGGARIREILEQVCSSMTAVWPLKDYVAVNPLGGFTEHRFLDARKKLRVYSDCETLMPLAYYANELKQGRLTVEAIELAIKELATDESIANANLTSESMVKQLRSFDPLPLLVQPTGTSTNKDRSLRTISEFVDGQKGTDWTTTIREEVSKHCAAHYDDGQAAWQSPWKDLPLYQAWLSAASRDRKIEILGLQGFRKFVTAMPATPEESIAMCLNSLGVPSPLWEGFLSCQMQSVSGWAAWAKFQVDMASRKDELSTDLIALIAMRLAYDVVLANQATVSVPWDAMAAGDQDQVDVSSSGAWSNRDDIALRHLLLRACEIEFRERLLLRLNVLPDVPDTAVPSSTVAQMVFCIDVRSERMRRHLEATSNREIETFGFAGFFGLPIEFVPIGSSSGNAQVPLLLSPKFQVHEGLRGSGEQAALDSIAHRTTIRGFRQAWKRFSTSAVGCFAAVETAGLLNGFSLLKRTLRWDLGLSDGHRFDGVAKADREHLGPMLCGLNAQGITTTHQADMAEGVLRGIGLTKNFAPLVVFCGHGSRTDNNPLAAGLDCGACGGHTGESNARFAAMLLNQPFIRTNLAERGIEIPDGTRFVAALHNTTNDEIAFFETDELPEESLGDFQQLAKMTRSASERNRAERLPIIASKSVADLMDRCTDWSEVRPEWGLAGNAAFIVGSRRMTESTDLDGRTFLHTYDHKDDPSGSILESIMTAPMVVAHLINMQYYASTVDNLHFGSGTKTVHNVVGRFGLFSGNGGDLMTGLPWQSLHTGTSFQHHPLRLLSVIAAPRASIERVLAKHAGVAQLLTNQWLHLVAIDESQLFRYTDSSTWEPITSVSALSN
ncbi:hypothetical protein Poly51_51570 [Rubripirellula tenax]|uniref:Probable inorganic carbon transporter subunit DabA n=1 Tax=Rubripirellula tenax TaxID=2528015 RepID=A0A5C6EH43_9BACT|nr:DUF2309 domain-containing protein [Rubripirellula tenax]TWU47357.1 hypothetical protein Poly51_51570 [Rubripirellula tenax]